MNTVKFSLWDTLPRYGKYHGTERLAIQLIDAGDFSPVATATVNLPEVELADDEVIIKDYSENEGMLEALMEAGLVSAPVRHAEAGFVTVPVCKFLGDAS